jgi:hypothetical protein
MAERSSRGGAPGSLASIQCKPLYMVKVKARLTPRSIASTFGLRPHSVAVKARLTPRSIDVAFGLRPHSISLSVRPRQSTHSESRKNQCECAAHVYKTFVVRSAATTADSLRSTHTYAQHILLRTCYACTSARISLLCGANDKG